MEKRLQELDKIIEIALDCNKGECAAVMDFGAGLLEYMFDLSAGLSCDPAGLAHFIEERVIRSVDLMLYGYFSVSLLAIEFYENEGRGVERIMKVLFEAENREGRSYKLRYERRIF